MNEKILAHLSTTPGTYQTAREVAQALGFAPGGASRPVAEALHVLVAEGKVEQEQHDGLLGSGPKRYRMKA